MIDVSHEDMLELKSKIVSISPYVRPDGVQDYWVHGALLSDILDHFIKEDAAVITFG